MLESIFDAPNGPDLPFGDPTLIILDSVRVAIISVGLITTLFIPLAMYRVRNSLGQLTRVAVLALFMLAAMGTEVSHFGDYAHWRLFLNIFATVGAGWGLWSLFAWETPAQIRPLNATKTR